MKKYVFILAVILLVCCLMVTLVACGENGKDGLTPYIGANGNWFVGDTDTGVSAQGGNGKSAFESYKESHPEFEGTEEDWANGLIGNGKATETGEFAYGKNADGVSYTLVSYTGADLGVDIPVSYAGFPVTAIGDNAFINNKTIQSITIHDKITSIGANAFYNCSGLKGVCITDLAAWCNISLGNEYANPLYYAKNLYLNGELLKGDLVIPDTVTTISSCAFYYCSGLTSITIPDSVTSIGNYAFAWCSGLTSITVASENSVYHSQGDCLIETATGRLLSGCKNSILPDDGSVIGIGEYAFSGCSGLTSITIPDSVTSIGSYAFSGCSGLTNITIPDSVTSIGEGAFSRCSGLTSITLPFVGSSASKKSGDTYQYPFGYIFGTSSYTGGTKIEQYYYGSSTSSTTSSTYYIPTSLRSVTITGGNILYGAFYNCSDLTSITILDGVTSIGQYAFHSCSGLTSVTIGNGVTSIGNSVFYECRGLTSVTIGNSVTSIGSSAFSGCSGLQSITIPDSVTSIGQYAFSGCSGLQSITIPDSVTSIGQYAFSGCSSLESITLPFVGASASKTSSDKYQYPFGYIFGTSSYTGGTKTEQHYYGSSISSTTSEIYYIPTSLKSVTITGGIILPYAFYNCSGLTSVTIGNGVKSIGQYAFHSCKGLKRITIPNSVISIGSSAFYGCSGLTTVNWNAINCTSAGSSSLPIFSGCTKLETVIIGDKVETIPSYAFYNCSGLTSVTIGNSVTSIGNYAFEYCYKLVEVWNKSSLTITVGSTDNGYVGYYALNIYTEEGGSKLVTDENGFVIYDGTTLVGYVGTATDITIPNAIQTINQYAFYKCSGLTSITIPDSVTSIGSYAFAGCSGLTSITLPFVGAKAGVTSSDTYQYPFGYIFGTSSYDGGTKTTQYYYGSSTSSTTSSTYYIPTSLRRVTITGGNILYGAFYNCSGLTSITIPDSVTSIGEFAFYDCSGLTSITIPDSVTSIGDYAFRNCSGLTSVTIGNGVTSIGSSAFYGCSGLTSVTFADTTTWYAMDSGVSKKIDVTNASTNATYFKSTYYNYYWYKV